MTSEMRVKDLGFFRGLLGQRPRQMTLRKLRVYQPDFARRIVIIDVSASGTAGVGIARTLDYIPNARYEYLHVGVSGTASRGNRRHGGYLVATEMVTAGGQRYPIERFGEYVDAIAGRVDNMPPPHTPPSSRGSSPGPYSTGTTPIPSPLPSDTDSVDPLQLPDGSWSPGTLDDMLSSSLTANPGGVNTDLPIGSPSAIRKSTTGGGSPIDPALMTGVFDNVEWPE